MGRGGCHCRGHPRVRSSPPQQGDPQAWLFKGQLLVFGLRCPESDPSCPPSTFASVAPDMVGVELCPCGAINRPRSLTTRACTFPIRTRQPAIPNGSKQTPPLPLASIPDTAFGPHPLPPVDVPSKHRHGAHGGQARGPQRAWRREAALAPNPPRQLSPVGLCLWPWGRGSQVSLGGHWWLLLVPEGAGGGRGTQPALLGHNPSLLECFLF